MTVAQLTAISLIKVQGAIDKVVANRPNVQAQTVFVTTDGYRLYRHADGTWCDAPPDSPDNIDLVFHSDADGYPADNVDGRLDGHFET